LDFGRVLTFDYWRHFIKFNIVGLAGIVVNEALLIVLKSQGYSLIVASVIAIEVSILSNFVLNDLWTFRDRRHGHVVVRLAKFNGLMIIGLIANLVILYAFTAYLGVQYTISNLIGIGAAFLSKYWLSVKFAWIKREEESLEPYPPRAV
jgi:dolichol-phosphate mannosyltransferase